MHGSLGMGLQVGEESAACVRLGFVMHYCAAVPLATGELSILSLLVDLLDALLYLPYFEIISAKLGELYLCQ